jgi:hypothetical protein
MQFAINAGNKRYAHPSCSLEVVMPLQHDFNECRLASSKSVPRPSMDSDHERLDRGRGTRNASFRPITKRAGTIQECALFRRLGHGSRDLFIASSFTVSGWL